MWGAIGSAAFKWLGGKAVQKGIGAVSGYFGKKVDKEKNLDNLDAQYDIRTLKAGEGSLKDEYLTFLLTVPFLLEFFSGLTLIWTAAWYNIMPVTEAIGISSDNIINAFNSIEGNYANFLYMMFTYVFGKAGVGVYQRHQVKKKVIANGGSKPQKSSKKKFNASDWDRK